jgi:sterol desaturase/sphingolipid hydroxylase (fatty acid hydroxylase superfamily)
MRRYRSGVAGAGRRAQRWAGFQRIPTAAFVLFGVSVGLLVVSVLTGFRAKELRSEWGGLVGFLGFALDWKNYLPIVGILVAEAFWPVEPRRRGLRPSSTQDLLWFVLAIVVWAPMVHLIITGMSELFDGPLRGWRVDLSGSLPPWALFGLGFVIAEFLRYWVHRTFHRVPVLWRIHSVHHAQRDLSLWTDLRVHPLEVAARQVVVLFPFFVLGGVPTDLVALAGFAVAWYTPFYHANIRTDLGPLRWLLVTPQSHRVHHSTAPEHYDTNFGNVLCVFDRLFGTQSPDHWSYPHTGIDDPTFPHEDSVNLWDQLVTQGAQLRYPFRASAAAEGASG